MNAMKVSGLALVFLIQIGIFIPKSLEAAPISTWAVSDITKNEYPKIYSQWGSAWVKKLNKMQHQVAEKAALSPECDTVDIVALSEQMSVPKKSPVFFVDCENGKRFYISHSDLESANIVKSKQLKTAKLSDAAAINSCISSVASKIKYPSTFKSSIFSKSAYRAPNGNIAVRIDFEGRGDSGEKVPMKARCVFDNQGMTEPEISNR
jgi:hypothetical protein